MNRKGLEELSNLTDMISEVATDLTLPLFAEYMKPSKKNEKIKLLSTKLTYTIENLPKPIGICLLPNDNIVVSTTGDHKVRIFSGEDGHFVKEVFPDVGRTFRHPSDMVGLQDGRFAVRDHGGISLFDENGDFLNNLGEGIIKRCYGLTSDDCGHLITLNHAKESKDAKQEVEVVFIHVESGEIRRYFKLSEVIGAKPKSLCRFLACEGSELFIADLGLNSIYVVDLSNGGVDTFGTEGKGPGQFHDPAGIAIDDAGYTVIADAGNHRLQLFDDSKEHVGYVSCFDSKLQRPSGVIYDKYSEVPSLYILNLKGNSLTKLQLEK